MKGIILAGGTGNRLKPATLVTNKHLLPVYNKPMIYYPLETLVKAGLKNIMIVSGREHAGHCLSLLGSGKEFGVKLSFEVQEEAKGIAHALSLCKDFVDDEKMVVILGDNIFEDDIKPYLDKFAAQKSGGRIFLKKHSEPTRFGVAEIDGNRIIRIEEKPNVPKSDLVVTGLYMYPASVFNVIESLKPSSRGEYEITDVNNHYVMKREMEFDILKGFWSDAGTPESLFRASMFIREKLGFGTGSIVL